MNRKEVKEKRTRNSKLYENQDHSFTREIYLDAVHYKDENGSWKEMDDKLQEEIIEDVENNSADKVSKDYVNKKGMLKFTFKKHSKEQDTISISKDDTTLTWGLEGTTKSKAEKISDTELLYPAVMDGVDIRCRTVGEKVKEDLVLKSLSCPNSFTYLYSMKKLEAVQEKNRVSFLNEQGEEVFDVSAPYMKDAAGEKSEAIRIFLTQEKKNHCKIVFQADEKWLKDPERRFPVTIDPVTTTSKKATDIMDAHVDSLLEEDNFHQSIILKTKGGDNVQRSFLKFTLPDINTGDMILNAKLILVSLASDGKERTINVHRVLQEWDSETINWYNKPVYEETVQDSCKYTGDKQKYVTLDVTRSVKDWYQNGQNFGLMFKDDYELSGYTEFLSSDCDSGYQDMRPRIDITYANYSGLEDFWNYHSQNAGRAGTVHVNDYNGNLILVRPDLEMGGSRMPVSLKHVYNSNDREKNLGYGSGFCLNYHQTVKKVKISDKDFYQHTDGDGTVHYFYYDDSKKIWKDELGQELTLTVNAGTSEPYVIKDKEDNQLVFNSSGYLVKIRDKNSNVLTIAYSNNRISKITDGAGRITTLSYLKDSNGNVTDLSQIKTPSGQTITFEYTGHRLTAISDIDGEAVTYTFADNGNLSSLVNVDGYQLKYSYYNTAPYRVKKITEYGGSISGSSLSLSYGYNSTKFTDNKGRSEIYRFDNNGNLLYIHDGFGHAASGKYNKDGNHVNRLENETKLQDNIIQLLKDPIIQAGTIGWASKVYAEGTGNTSVNTDTKYCMVGTRSLKAVCTSESSYAYWAQNVTVKKGETYTASMYVRAEVTSTADDGGCLLRVRYLDKDGVQHLLDSEVLKKTTTDFVRLKRTFILPEDASSDSIKIYMVVWHAVGTMYGDMAQLETGKTANRCNLVDNGEFHRGSTSGFSKTGYTEDGLTAVGEACYLPMQAAMMVKVSSGIIYNQPSTSGTPVATVTKKQHLASSAMYKDGDGKIWYRVKNASGQWGYISSSSVVPYLGGSTCNNTAVVGVTGAVLRAAASDTGTPVEEYIPKGTSLALASTTTDANGKKWYYLGMQIDTTRYCGYLPVDVVIRLYRNYVYGKMIAADSYYQKPSRSSTVMSSVEAGATVILRGILEKSNGEKWYAVLKGTEFVFLPQANIELSVTGYIGRLSTTKVTEGVGGLDEHIYKFQGNPAGNKKLTKTLDIQGKKGDTYMVNAWGQGTALPETDHDTARRFGVEVIFIGTDGINDVHYTNFSPDILDWQFLSDVYVAKKDYSSIKVSYTYCHNANIAFFDGLSLFREEFGQSYTYDENNNLVSVIDARKQASQFEYNSTDDMVGITDAKGNKFTYEYDGKHNVTKGTSAQGLVYKLDYDSAGNVVKSGCVEPSNQSAGTWMTRVMTASKSYVASVTDAKNNTVQYVWDENKDLLSSITDARGSKLSYGYDNANRLNSVSQDVTQDGTKRTVNNVYIYTEDKLTGISHNGFSYGFAYDSFGNVLNASVSGIQIVNYEYEANNGNLKKVNYANGDYIRYTYDEQDRMMLSYYKSASGTEQKLNEYVYDRSGNLTQVANHMSGKSYDLDYDFLDRLMRVRDNDGNYYEYTYDENNNMTRMYHGVGTSGIATTYTYDKDGREVTAKASSNYYRTTDYDSLGRVLSQMWSTSTPSGVTYQYNDTDRTKRSDLPSALLFGNGSLGYSYDGNGNITRIQESDTNESGGATKTISYQYDELNRLIREDNQILNKTVTYSYDLGGNLLSEKEYDYTTGTLPASATVTKTGTYDTAWKDKLLSWNGTSMTYDAIGNMLTKGSTRYTWTQGRKLASVQNGKNIQYYYDYTRNRTKKVVDGVTTQFRYAGDLLVSERTGSEKNLWYRYDSAGNVISVTYDSEIYLYVRNAQNDIIGLLDKTGNIVVRYIYDSWGQVIKIEGSQKDRVGARNPFRYKGYYYDEETGMYYLKNRYYDPKLRRFISSDELFTVKASPETFHNRNLYSYCNDNPIIRNDHNGDIWGVAALSFVVGSIVSIGTQIVCEKRKLDNIDWVSAAFAGLGTALAFMGASTALQCAVSVASDVYNGISQGEEPIVIAFNAAGNLATNLTLSLFDLRGMSYRSATEKYNAQISRIKNLNLGGIEAIPHYVTERKIYNNNLRRIVTSNVQSYTISNVTSKVYSTTTNYAINSCHNSSEKRIIGWSCYYNGRTGYRVVKPVYSY